MPRKTSVMAATVFIPEPMARDILSLFASSSFRYHMTSSSSMSATSATGSPVPGSAILPDASMLPDASTMCSKASDCAAIVRNWLPSPLPSHAPLIRPGRSTSSTGIKRQPSIQSEFLGLSRRLNSL